MTIIKIYVILKAERRATMYIDYSKLWQLLSAKNMTKTDLCRLTGISSRVMAKLVKCETVTTDTISRICEALDCDVGDIMECRANDGMTLYELYRKFGKKIGENELYKTVSSSFFICFLHSLRRV